MVKLLLTTLTECDGFPAFGFVQSDQRVGVAHPINRRQKSWVKNCQATDFLANQLSTNPIYWSKIEIVHSENSD